ncbi:MAG: hypothetical protein ACLP6E_09155 [Acidimicrobiales bacterium]
MIKAVHGIRVGTGVPGWVAIGTFTPATLTSSRWSIAAHPVVCESSWKVHDSTS